MKYQVPQLKLKFKIANTTQLDSKTVIGLLVLKLKEKEYKILEETDNSLTFYTNPWMPRWNFQPYIALDGGNVKIVTSNNSSLVSLSYYLDFFPELLSLSLLVIFTTVDKQYDATLFFSCGYFVFSIVSIIRAKWGARQILKETLDEDVIE